MINFVNCFFACSIHKCSTNDVMCELIDLGLPEISYFQLLLIWSSNCKYYNKKILYYNGQKKKMETILSQRSKVGGGMPLPRNNSSRDYLRLIVGLGVYKLDEGRRYAKAEIDGGMLLLANRRWWPQAEIFVDEEEEECNLRVASELHQTNKGTLKSPPATGSSVPSPNTFSSTGGAFRSE